MKRREFITLLGGAAAAWPLAARAQQRERVRRIGVLGIADDVEAQSWVSVLVTRLQELGWTNGRNVQIDYRFGLVGRASNMQVLAKELIDLHPDLIIAVSTSATVPLSQQTTSIPIVFVGVSDPVGLGVVESLAHPGGNITGFTLFEFSIATKWLEVLKETAPHMTRIGVLVDPKIPTSAMYLRAIETAPTLSLPLTRVDVGDVADISRAFDAFAGASADGVIVLPGPVMLINREQIVATAARQRVPAIYPFRYFITSGGLVSYSVDLSDLYRRAASYVDRILRGEKPTDLPVQQPTKFELVINLKTAKALGLDSAAVAARPRRRGDRMKRREFITLLGGAATTWPLAAHAQQAPRPVIGLLGSGTAAAQSEWTAALLQRLRELGWSEGRNLTIEYRWGEGRTERFSEIAAEFVQRKVTIILTHNTPPTLAAKQATSSIPIVFATAGDPIGAGIVASLARPGGNITGLSSQTPDAAGKKLELFRQVVPGLHRLATLADVDNPYVALDLRQIKESASTLGIEVATFEIRRSEELESAFDALKQRVDALYVLPVPLLFANRGRISALALSARLPTLHGVREYVEAGGLMSYGPNWPHMWRRAADLVDKILRGAKPGDIPVEQPTEFDLVINLTTAKALGLTIPEKLLALANEVIE